MIGSASLTDQNKIELAYLTKEMVEMCIENRAKLYFEQANCYLACFYACRRLLQEVDPEYLDHHSEVKDFFREGRELSNDWDRMSWDPPENTTPGTPVRGPILL